MYSKEVLKRFKNPKNAGEIKNADVVAEVGNLKCGDVIKVSLEVKNGKIKDVKFMTYGCVSAIAASDMLCDLAKGKTLETAQKIKFKDILEKLGGLPPIKYHCSVMAVEALQKALKDYLKTEKKKDKDKVKNKPNKTNTKKYRKNFGNLQKITEKTTLGKLPQDSKTQKILAKHGVPCISCPHIGMEQDFLTLGFISKTYGIDLKALLKDLNK
jgi:nitrogen fixation NifU-like protein